jgi:hypothetical protein
LRSQFESDCVDNGPERGEEDSRIAVFHRDSQFLSHPLPCRFIEGREHQRVELAHGVLIDGS